VDQQLDVDGDALEIGCRCYRRYAIAQPTDDKKDADVTGGINSRRFP